MSVPGLPQEVYEVPLYSKDGGSRGFLSYFSAKKPRGTIRYHGSAQVLQKVPGFFSFTFYLPDKSTMWFKGKYNSVYFKGLDAYLTLVKTVPEFQGWRLLIYTDQKTLEELSSMARAPEPTRGSGASYDSDEWAAVQHLFTSPDHVTFATVEWPAHYPRPGVPQVNGAVLRPLRSRAPFDFRNAMIFIRDADTLFEEDLNRMDPEKFQTYLRDWEVAFLKLIPEIQAYKGTPSLLIVGSGNAGSSRIYHKDWHENELLKKKSPFGIFAGFVNVTPGVPVYQTMDAWDEFVDYVDQRSVRQMNKPMNPLVRQYLKTYKNKSYPVSAQNLNAYIKKEASYSKNAALREKGLRKQLQDIFYPFSNDGTKHSIGRDEQMYLFILMPKALKNLVIFRIELGDIKPPVWTNDPSSQLDPENRNFTQPYERANYHSRLFNAFQKTADTGFQTISKVKLPPPNYDRYRGSTWNEEEQTNILEYNKMPSNKPTPLTPLTNDPGSPRPGTPQPTNGNNPVVSGGKRKTRRHVRSKFEKRKTRKHR